MRTATRWSPGPGSCSTFGAVSRFQKRPLQPGSGRPTPGHEAFHGLAGRFVEYLDPATEAAPVALLVQFLIGFGNLIGRTAYFKAESDTHYTNEFAVLVGRSSRGRKGTSQGRVRAVLRPLDEHWVDHQNVPGGLSSGRG